MTMKITNLHQSKAIKKLKPNLIGKQTFVYSKLEN